MKNVHAEAKSACWHMITTILDFQRLKTNRKGCGRMHCVTKKSMDDEGLRFQIINLLKSAGASSSDRDLNNAVMNMLKILPPPVVKLKLEECLPTNSCLLRDQIPYPPPAEYDFTFIDLFAGIGGFRLAFQKAGGRSIFSSEWDEPAQKTYEANYGEIPVGDIRAVDKDAIPAHDVLCAGFPCQPFSLAGVSKKNSMGRPTGFEDQTQGTLFFEIKEIISKKRPAAFMLENVKNLFRHDQGRTFEVIRHTLEDILGYVVNWKIVDGSKWVPQHRERLFIVGYNPDLIDIKKEEIVIPSEPLPEEHFVRKQLRDIILPHVEGYTLGPGTWNTLERHKAHHESEGNGFGYGLHRMPIKKDEITRTISARYHKDGAEILIEQPGNRPRRLTVEEAMQLQGYDPAHFVFPVSKTQAYKQIGNSVVWPAIHSCAREIAKVLKTRRKKR